MKEVYEEIKSHPKWDELREKLRWQEGQYMDSVLLFGKAPDKYYNKFARAIWNELYLGIQRAETC